MNDIWNRRNQLLEEAVKKAVLELWAHQSIVPTAIHLPLDDGRLVTVSVERTSGPERPAAATVEE